VDSGLHVVYRFALSLVLKGKYPLITETGHLAFIVVCFLQVLAAFKSKSFGSRLVGIIALAVVFINLGSNTAFIWEWLRTVSIAVLNIVPFIINTLCCFLFSSAIWSHEHFSRATTDQVQKAFEEENLRKEQEKTSSSWQSRMKHWKSRS
jgi:hypothetical protein